jgi:hypothetical protein
MNFLIFSNIYSNWISNTIIINYLKIKKKWLALINQKNKKIKKKDDENHKSALFIFLIYLSPPYWNLFLTYK